MSKQQKQQSSSPKELSEIPAKYKNYTPEEKEKHLFHALIEQENWDKGTKLSKPSLQKFNKPSWDNFKKNAIQLGYSVTVLYEPE